MSSLGIRSFQYDGANDAREVETPRHEKKSKTGQSAHPESGATMKQTRKSRTSTQNLNNFPHATKTLGSMLQNRSQSMCRLAKISPRSLARCSPDRQRPATHPRTCPLDQARATKTSMVMMAPLKMTPSKGGREGGEDLEDIEIKNKTQTQRQFVPNIHGTSDALKKGDFFVIVRRPERDLLDSERPDKFFRP